MLINQLFKPSLLLILLTLSITSNFGQQCLTSVKRAQTLAEHPPLMDQLRTQEVATQRWIADNRSSINFRSVETVPVVVHVIWKESQENISDEQIMSQIEVLNDDFRKLNSNFGSGPMAFKALGADVEIEFCLASIDPSGNKTNGITRTQTSMDGIGGTDNWYNTSNGGQDAWDIDRYVNIWVCDLGEDGLLGFATPPGTADPPESDGLAVAYQYFGTTGTAANSQPNHLGRTTTHEMGHYFNLEHLWGMDFGGCNEDDFVDDTPIQDFESTGCPTFPALDNCTGSGDGIMFNNYMDYSDDECMTMFTVGQKMRMLAALNGPRALLLEANACGISSVDEEVTTLRPSVFPNPAHDQIVVTFPERYLQHEVFVIYNSVGEEMFKFKAGINQVVDVTEFPSGIYYLVSSNRSVAAQKFIIAK